MPQVRASDGTSIAYDVFGRPDGEPLLMIQGLGADARGWALQRFPFGRRFRCYAVDNRGVGRSDKPDGPYDLLQMAADAIAVLDAEGVERAHVMGASMGGVLTQIIGVRFAERARSLTLACTAARHHDWRRELLLEWREQVSTGGMGGLSEGALEWLVGPRLRRRFGVWLNLLARILLQTPAEPFMAQIDAILDFPDTMREELDTIVAPTLVIVGSQDALTPVGDSEEIQELIPHAELTVLSGAAHGLMAETPNAYNARVLDFLERVSDVEQPGDEADAASA